jgi:hypothetical protein
VPLSAPLFTRTTPSDGSKLSTTTAIAPQHTPELPYYFSNNGSTPDNTAYHCDTTLRPLQVRAQHLALYQPSSLGDPNLKGVSLRDPSIGNASSYSPTYPRTSYETTAMANGRGRGNKMPPGMRKPDFIQDNPCTTEDEQIIWKQGDSDVVGKLAPKQLRDSHPGSLR